MKTKKEFKRKSCCVCGKEYWLSYTKVEWDNNMLLPDGNYICSLCKCYKDAEKEKITLTKEELKLLDAYLTLVLPEYNNFDKGTKMYKDMKKLHKISEKISKLSKEKENE